MSDLPNVSPIPLPPFITAEEVRAVLEGLDPGWYRARDLHPRYEALASAAGRQVASVKALGEALRRAKVPSRKIQNNISAYGVGV